MDKSGEFAGLDASGITAECLARASDGWDGSPLPNCPAGKPVISIYKYAFPSRATAAAHIHKIINCGVVTKGRITLVLAGGKEKAFMAGEAVVEVDGEARHGENRGGVPAEVIMFHAGDGKAPFSFPA